MKRILTSCFGLGFLPGLPGTFTSLLVLLIFAGLFYLAIPLPLLILILTALCVAASIICILFTPAIEALAGKKDPREIVIDEFAGQALTYLIILLLIPKDLMQMHVWLFAFGGFALFRLFDIAKPWPIRKFERLPAGFGVLADDLAAALFAGLLTSLAAIAGDVNIAEFLPFAGSKLNIFTAVFLGLVQGLTEFLPVSSSGHLVLFEHLFGFNPEKSEMLLFDLIIHTGTVIAIFVVFRRMMILYFTNLASAFGRPISLTEKFKKIPSFRITILAVITTFVTAGLGFAFENFLERTFASILLLGIMWIVNGIFLVITDRKRGHKGLRDLGIAAAIIIGIAQAIAIIPSISRSGATICAAILLGIRRRWAVEYSFLIAIPAIVGATAVELAKNAGHISVETLPAVPLLLGFITATISGVFALKVLIDFTRRARLKVFAFYCFCIACLVLIYCLQ